MSIQNPNQIPEQIQNLLKTFIHKVPSEQSSIICLDLSQNDTFYISKGKYGGYLIKPKRSLENVKCFYVSKIETNILGDLSKIVELFNINVKPIEEMLNDVASKLRLNYNQFVGIREVKYNLNSCEVKVQKEKEEYLVVDVNPDLSTNIEVKAFHIYGGQYVSYSSKHVYDGIIVISYSETESKYFDFQTLYASDKAYRKGYAIQNEYYEILEKIKFSIQYIAKLLNTEIYEAEEKGYKYYRKEFRAKVIPKESIFNLANFLGLMKPIEVKPTERIEALKEEVLKSLTFTIQIPNEVFEKFISMFDNDYEKMYSHLVEVVKDYIYQIVKPIEIEIEERKEKVEQLELIKETTLTRKSGCLTVNVVSLNNIDVDKVYVETYINGEKVYSRTYDVKVYGKRKIVNIVLPMDVVKKYSTPLTFKFKIYKIKT